MRLALSFSYPAPGKVDFLEVDASFAVAACRAYTAGPHIHRYLRTTNYDKAHLPYDCVYYTHHGKRLIAIATSFHKNKVGQLHNTLHATINRVY